MRHFPVQSIEEVRYLVRGGSGISEKKLEVLDKRIMDNDVARGYNRGVVTIWPTRASLESAFSAARFISGRYTNVINVLFDYTHGWTKWPGGLAKVVTEACAAFVMEIMGEALTAGLSMRSVDAYSESYTASATTTIFSARRLFYLDEFKKMKEKYRKPIWV